MIILGTNSIKDTGYEVANSCRFDGSSAYLVKNFSSSANRKTMTISMWVKGFSSSGVHTLMMAGSQAEDRTQFTIDSGKFAFTHCSGISSNTKLLETTRLFRDPAAWYNFVVQLDSTQGTAANRTKIFCNGEQLTSFGTEQYVDQNEDFYFSFASYHTHIGRFSYSSSNFFSGYMAEIVQLTGSAVTPSTFGEADEDSPTIWKPKDLSDLDLSSTNSFYLDFEDSSALGNDVSGNNNDFTSYNLAATDQSTDTCTNNFATLNRLAWTTGTGLTFSEGNLKVANSVSDWRPVISTIPVTTGKWYCEIKCTAIGSGAQYGVTPITDYNDPGNLAFNIGDQARTFVYINDGNKENNGSAASYGNTYTTNDIIGIAIDLTNNYIYFSKNGNFQASGDPTSGSSGTNAAYALTDGYYYGFTFATNAGTAEINFGSPSFSISSGNTDGNGYGNFEYAVPSGYYSLCTKNLAEYG